MGPSLSTSIAFAVLFVPHQVLTAALSSDVGCAVGSDVGEALGVLVGVLVGVFVGRDVGCAVGSVGCDVGEALGVLVGGTGGACGGFGVVCFRFGVGFLVGARRFLASAQSFRSASTVANSRTSNTTHFSLRCRSAAPTMEPPRTFVYIIETVEPASPLYKAVREDAALWRTMQQRFAKVDPQSGQPDTLLRLTEAQYQRRRDAGVPDPSAPGTGPEEYDPRNDVLTSAKRAEERKHAKYDSICAATGSIFSPIPLETTAGHDASTASVYFLFTKQMRDSSLPADVLVGKLKKDISFALRRGTIPSEGDRRVASVMPMDHTSTFASQSTWRITSGAIQ